VTPDRLLKLVRRWMTMVVLFGVLGAGAAYGSSRLMTKIYQADGSVVVNAAPGGPSNSLSLTADQVTSTEAALMTGRSILQRVINDLHLNETVETLSAHVAASAEPNTEIIHLLVRDPSPTRAATIANQVMNDFVSQVSADNASRIAAAGATLSDQIDQLTKSLASENVQMATAEAAHQDTTALRQEIQANSALLAQLTNNYSSFQAQQAENLNTVSIASSAVAPPAPASPRVLLNTVLGLLGGLVLGGGLVTTLEYMDQRLRTPEDVRERLDLPTLAVIPRFRRDRGHGGTRGNSMAGEAYRRLRTNVMFAAVDRPLTSVVIVSVRAGEGKSRTAANLAGVVAAAGQRVVLVDADMRRPTLHNLFGCGGGRGLSEFLLSLGRRNAAALDSVVSTQFSGLSLLSAGTLPPNPGELLAHRQAAGLVRAMERDFDTVVIDTPPVSVVADSLNLAASASATVLVIEAGRTNAREVLRALEALRGVGANVIGVVLNKAGGRSGDYYSYRYRSYGYGGDDGDLRGGPGGDGTWAPIVDSGAHGASTGRPKAAATAVATTAAAEGQAAPVQGAS
jgi:tyrosine-protein kinase